MQISFDTEKVRNLIAYLDGIENGAEKALYRTLTDVQRKAKTAASRLIRTELALSKAYVDSKLNVGKPSYKNLTASVYAEKRGILLTRFNYRQNTSQSGYSVLVKQSNGYKSLPGAFLLPNLLNSNATGLAIRTKGKVKVLHGPSISQVMNTFLPTLNTQMSKVAGEQLEKEVTAVLRQKGF